jgi:hypothetical protein
MPDNGRRQVAERDAPGRGRFLLLISGNGKNQSYRRRESEIAAMQSARR